MGKIKTIDDYLNEYTETIGTFDLSGHNSQDRLEAFFDMNLEFIRTRMEAIVDSANDNIKKSMNKMLFEYNWCCECGNMELGDALDAVEMTVKQMKGEVS